MNKIIRIEHDQDCDCPMDNDGSWKLYSFNRNSVHFAKSGQFTEENDDGDEVPSPELAVKLETGLAFVLDYYEHGRGLYSIHGSGPQCEWDTSRGAGLVVWENKPEDLGANTVEDRQRDAEGFLDEYNAWANGDCYWFSVETAEGEQLDSCGGFLDTDYMLAVINESLEPGDCVKLVGDCAGGVRESKIQAEVVEDFPEEDDEEEEVVIVIQQPLQSSHTE